MMSLLQKLQIFEVKPLITNLSCKLSTVSNYDARKQLLCLVSDENDIVFRYTNDSGQEAFKLISWFRRTNRIVHDVCFDPSGTWLLVLCFDNTLHILPALAIIDKSAAMQLEIQQQPFSITHVTSYIIPFVGPHECPNSKTCPNQHSRCGSSWPPMAASSNRCEASKPTRTDANPMADAVNSLSMDMSLKAKIMDGNPSSVTLADKNRGPDEKSIPLDELSMDGFSQEVPLNMIIRNEEPAATNEAPKLGDSELATPFMASRTCPYPLSVVWWQTMDGQNRAIIGYSDGSICFVGLSPNCPFVASTTIESGSVMKLLICRDISYRSVMLLITSTLKQQYKLLLEQKAIKYVYPGDISPTSLQANDGNWQIVMPIKSTSNSSDPASDNSQLEEDVFLKGDDDMVGQFGRPSHASTTHLLSESVQATRAAIPPPPPYSVAVNRTLSDSTSLMTSPGLRYQQQQLTDVDDMSGRPGILPAARARLASLKSLGSKKLSAIKLRLSDNRQKLEGYISENSMNSFTIMDSPSLTPEILNTSTDSFYTIQNLRNTYLLSALHSQTNTLSVHNIDINLKPLFLYKIPKNCYEILISSNLLYSIQYVDLIEQKSTDDVTLNAADIKETVADNALTEDSVAALAGGAEGSEQRTDGSADTSVASSSTSTSSVCSTSNLINAVGVISSAMASMKGADDNKFMPSSLLNLFRFENETVLNLYQMATYRSMEKTEPASKEEKVKAFTMREIRSPMEYVQFYETIDVQEEYSLRQMEIMKSEFPRINYDPCYVVTNKNVYYIQLKKEPFAIFLDAALITEWAQCREFCNTFDLSYEYCMEFVGDYLLRRKKVAQALMTYNAARLKPIRTALKLAMFGQTYALMHLCAMALRSMYILKSQYFCNPIMKTLLDDITYRHSEDVRLILPPKTQRADITNLCATNEGVPCSDYVYGVDESISNLQMSPSSQFHLANLLLITLTEKAVNDKNYIALWNFLSTNTKFHTNMTSIVLCQSGLFCAALLLAKVRGVCLDTFLALTSVLGQEFELNVCLYNLSEPIFTESITYLPQVAIDYFVFIQDKLDGIRDCVLKRLEQQLNPFSAVLRPVVSRTSSWRSKHNSIDNNTYLLDFCKTLIETYLAVLIHMESQWLHHDNIANALSTFRLTYEDNQFAILGSRFKPISAGCAHCACVVDGVAYFWGSNGVPCNYSASKSSDPPEPPHAVKCLEVLSKLNLEVHAVKCGRQHTLILTNNGLYSMGSNMLGQLGIGLSMQMSLQPMLVKAMDGNNVTILEAGQYHNAIVANGQLYTWGWGVYGQLGHGDTENVMEPKLVDFFKRKVILQVALGHAHSLVLCQAACGGIGNTELYVFGSNHFGQLGIGSSSDSVIAQCTRSAHNADEHSARNQVKSALPIKLDIKNKNIRLIHTKFFTNLAVDEDEQMFTWGSSPQALRLANQIKRRANAKQKLEENHRREMSHRFETFISNIKYPLAGESTEDATTSCNATCDLTEATSQAEPEAQQHEQQPSEAIESDREVLVEEEEEEEEEVVAATKQDNVDDQDDDDEEEQIVGDESSAIDLLTSITPTNVTAVITDAVDEENEKKSEEQKQEQEEEGDEDEDEDEEESLDFTLASTKNLGDLRNENEAEAIKQEAATVQRTAPEIDPCEHMTPHLVDTSEVAGQIKQLASGLFHFAMISSTRTLYTWGKNLEHQLGTEDRERRSVAKPSPIDIVDSPMSIDCGADFTLVMTSDYVVKAFGGNSNGQCGRDLGPSIDKMKQRVICLPTTKRLMRFESQCVEVPVEINLPRPQIRLDTQPVRYLKSIPRFQAHFLQEAAFSLETNSDGGGGGGGQCPSRSRCPKSTMSRSGDNPVVASDQCSEDAASSPDNFSYDSSSLNSLRAGNARSGDAALAADMDSCRHQNSSYDGEGTSDEQSYMRLPMPDKADQSSASTSSDGDIGGGCDGGGGGGGGGGGYVDVEADTDADKDTNGPALLHRASPSSVVDDDADAMSAKNDESIDYLGTYIHYCLYVFHGLYSPEKIRELSRQRLEYSVRTHMLNFQFVDAFRLCLNACNTPTKSIRTFEYFTKDTSSVPLRRQDLRYFIYYLLQHFIACKFDVSEAERFFASDLDYYLLGLAYVLYFNNNNTMLEQNLNQKFKSLIARDPNYNDGSGGSGSGSDSGGGGVGVGVGEHKLDDTDNIFDNLSVKFKTILCQRLLKHCSN